MKFTNRLYQGEGVNHEGEAFKGTFEVEPISETSSYRYTYTAIRTDGVKVHEESGLISTDEAGRKVLVVLMDELPCLSTYHQVDEGPERIVFAYQGKGNVEGFNGELVFEPQEAGFKLLHRWAMGTEPTDKSWCELDVVN